MGTVTAFLLAGLALGGAQLLALRATAARWLARPGPALAASHVLRMGALAAAFVLVARAGGARGLVAALAGFTLAQGAALRARGRS